MSQQKKPSELNWDDYRSTVETSADAVEEKLDDYAEDYESLHEAIWETVDGDRWCTQYARSLMTVLLSPQNPDSPDYCEPWTTYVDLQGDPSYGEVVNAMAYVCLYSDVYEEVERRYDDIADGE